MTELRKVRCKDCCIEFNPFAGHACLARFQYPDPPQKKGDAPKADSVNHPKHYTSDPSGVECITITRHRNFNIGNAIKYLWRAGLKFSAALDTKAKQIEDLEKARWYIADEIERIRKEA